MTNDRTERKTIFLTDDDPTNLTTGKKVLSGVYKVFPIDSGEQLLQNLERTIPDLILLDIEMPGMNGYETIKAIKAKKETADVPVIFLTGRSGDDSELEGLSLGAVDYISKPFSPSLLLKRIEIHLLMESQKKSLISFNDNLQEMVMAKTASVVELQNSLIQTMAELVEYRDDVTGEHTARTQKYLEALLEKLHESGLYKEETESWDMELVLQSAKLHDVGKIAVEDAILQKPGKLTGEEFEQIKEHARVGEEMIEKAIKRTKDQVFLEYAKVFAASHHEKWDGTGYPKGLKGEEIPLLGRLMAIVDVYDALRSERPYKKAYTSEEAAGIIRQGREKHFDPALTDIFLSVVETLEVSV